MAGINISGSPQTRDYLLGRGALYFAPNTDGEAGAYRHLGNAPEFALNVEVETLEHQSSLEGLKTIDLEVIVSQKIGLSFTLDEINFDNVALWGSGETETYDNATAIAGFAEYTMIASAELGRWYDIVSNTTPALRVYNIDPADVTVESPDATVKVLDTDYQIDAFAGRIKILEEGSIAAAAAVLITLAANAGAGTVDRVKMLTTTNVRGALKFIGENPANNDEQYEIQVHQVNLKPDGDAAFIGDEFATLGFTGTAESNAVPDPDSPYITVSCLTP
jgi:hypothetical protein